MNAMEELEAQVRDVLDRMRRMSEEGRDPATAYNLGKLGELADRMQIQLEAFRKELVEAGYLADDGEPQGERQRVRREYRAKADEPSPAAAEDERSETET